jgi:hypothetical protein
MDQAGGVGTAGLFLFDGCRLHAGCMTQDTLVFDGMNAFLMGLYSDKHLSVSSV